MALETETGGMRLQARDAWSPGSWKSRKDPPPEPPEGARPWDTLISDSWLPHWEGTKVCCSQPRSWCFVSAAPVYHQIILSHLTSFTQRNILILRENFRHTNRWKEQ